MDWQQVISLGIVGIAGAMLTRGWVMARRRRSYSPCGCENAGGCGRPTPIKVSGRKGEPARVSRG